VDVASQAGHAPTMTLDTYAHLFAELEGADRTSSEHLIRMARVEVVSPDVSVLCPCDDDTVTTGSENPRKSKEPTPGLEPGTPSLRVKCSTS
jgi:hypothetical protein